MSDVRTFKNKLLYEMLKFNDHELSLQEFHIPRRKHIITEVGAETG